MTTTSQATDAFLNADRNESDPDWPRAPVPDARPAGRIPVTDAWGRMGWWEGHDLEELAEGWSSQGPLARGEAAHIAAGGSVPPGHAASGAGSASGAISEAISEGISEGISEAIPEAISEAVSRLVQSISSFEAQPLQDPSQAPPLDAVADLQAAPAMLRPDRRRGDSWGVEP